jgi:GxxExxY protein
MEPDEEMNYLTSRVIGAAIEIHRALGPGYQESIYEEALAFELKRMEIGFERQRSFVVKYLGHVVGEGRVDFLVKGKLVVELKSTEKMQPVYKAQVISYLKAMSCQIGLLINFNESMLRSGIQRIIYSDPPRLCASAANLDENRTRV